MKPRFLAFALAPTLFVGCASDYVPPRPGATPSPAYEREMQEGRPGLFGDLRWNIDLSSGQRTAAADNSTQPSVAEQEEFKKWRESAGRSERQEFEEWRAWQEWKRQNPK